MNVNKMYINGEWVNSQSNKTFVDYSPVTDSDYALITDADQKDTKRAIEAAHAAFPAWSALQPEERANYLL